VAIDIFHALGFVARILRVAHDAIPWRILKAPRECPPPEPPAPPIPLLDELLLDELEERLLLDALDELLLALDELLLAMLEELLLDALDELELELSPPAPPVPLPVEAAGLSGSRP